MFGLELAKLIKPPLAVLFVNGLEIGCASALGVPFASTLPASYHLPSFAKTAGVPSKLAASTFGLPWSSTFVASYHLPSLAFFNGTPVVEIGLIVLAPLFTLLNVVGAFTPLVGSPLATFGFTKLVFNVVG